MQQLWLSKQWLRVSRLSAEVEYHEVAHVVAERVWLRLLLLELHRPIEHATIVYFDNILASPVIQYNIAGPSILRLIYTLFVRR
jgi:hypothetical protein